MRHSRVLGAFTFVVAMLALSPSRGDYDVGLHGSICVGKTSADNAKLEYEQWGVRNASTSDPAAVFCPIGYMDAGGTFTTTVWHDSTLNASCNFFIADNAGFELYTLPFSTSGQANPLVKSQSKSLTGYARLECSLPKTVSGASAWVASVRIDD